MAVLAKIRHEQFAQALVSGLNATSAYISAGYKKAGAAQNAARLIKNDKVCARVRELQTTVAAGVIQLEISNRNARVQALNDRWNELRSALQYLLCERGKDMAGVPGGRSGLLCREFKGKDGRKESYRVDPGLMALLGEIRAHERQAAEELGQVAKSESTAIDATELMELLNAGRQRAREDWEKRQALAAGTQTEA